MSSNQSDSKPFYESKVFWFNLVTLALMIVEVLTTQQLFAPDALKWLTAISAIGNVLLRFLTTMPLDAPQIVADGPLVSTEDDA